MTPLLCQKLVVISIYVVIMHTTIPRSLVHLSVTHWRTASRESEVPKSDNTYFWISVQGDDRFDQLTWRYDWVRLDESAIRSEGWQLNVWIGWKCGPTTAAVSSSLQLRAPSEGALESLVPYLVGHCCGYCFYETIFFHSPTWRCHIYYLVLGSSSGQWASSNIPYLQTSL